MAWVGGKAGSGVYQRIINELPPHRVYIEPFLGGGAVLRHKRPAAVSYGVDLAPGALAAFSDAAGVTVGSIVGAGDVGRRHLVEGCGVQFLRGYEFVGDELVYCDPPYLMATRRGGRALYEHEFCTDDEHAALLGLLVTLPCAVAISGYWSSLYDRLLVGWRLVRFTAQTRGGPAEECLWLNYPEPVALHDYRYLGGTFRERERIKRRTQRWRDRLARMDVLERRALLAALADLDHR